MGTTLAKKKRSKKVLTKVWDAHNVFLALRGRLSKTRVLLLTMDTNAGFILGARSGLAWGCVKGAASVSLAFTSQYDTQEHEDVLSAVRDMDHKDIRKHACASLWDEYGEMKGRFPEHHTESAKAMDVSQNEIRQQAVSVLPQIQGILDSMNT